MERGERIARVSRLLMFGFDDRVPNDDAAPSPDRLSGVCVELPDELADAAAVGALELLAGVGMIERPDAGGDRSVLTRRGRDTRSLGWSQAVIEDAIRQRSGSRIDERE